MRREQSAQLVRTPGDERVARAIDEAQDGVAIVRGIATGAGRDPEDRHGRREHRAHASIVRAACVGDVPLLAMRALLALVALPILLGGCGGSKSEEDRVASAVKQYIRAFREQDLRTFCRKRFLSTDLPRALSRKLGVSEGQPATPSAWDRHYRGCRRELGKHGEFDQSIGPFKIEHIALGPAMTGANGVSRTARVTITLPRAKKRSKLPPLPMVKFRGDWKVVFDVN